MIKKATEHALSIILFFLVTEGHCGGAPPSMPLTALGQI
jgi:hypothetical protein